MLKQFTYYQYFYESYVDRYLLYTHTVLGQYLTFMHFFCISLSCFSFHCPVHYIFCAISSLSMQNLLGEGQFGRVFKGTARNIITRGETSMVAVKCLKGRQTIEYCSLLLCRCSYSLMIRIPHLALLSQCCIGRDGIRFNSRCAFIYSDNLVIDQVTQICTYVNCRIQSVR